MTPPVSVARQPIRVFFLIRSLGLGGAERQLVALARSLNKARFAVTVAAMYDDGPLGRDLEGVPGVRLVTLGKAGRWDTAGFFRRLWREIRRDRPHVLHGYMGGANEICLALGKLTGARVIWGVRVSDLDFSRYIWSVGALFRAGALLSRQPDLIIANSHAGRATHVARGYDPSHFIVIPNGIDTERFQRDAAAGTLWRAAAGYAHDDFIIGCPARLDPMKDHPSLLEALRLVTAAGHDVQLACPGGGPESYRAELAALAQSLGIGERVRWLPATPDPRAFYSGVDLLTSASAFGEGFPNVLGEAMACEVPCVATMAGDSAFVIGDAGVAVPVRDAKALAGGWEQMLALSTEERRALGRRARERMCTEFTIPELARRTADALEAVVQGRSAE